MRRNTFFQAISWVLIFSLYTSTFPVLANEPIGEVPVPIEPAPVPEPLPTIGGLNELGGDFANATRAIPMLHEFGHPMGIGGDTFASPFEDADAIQSLKYIPAYCARVIAGYATLAPVANARWRRGRNPVQIYSDDVRGAYTPPTAAAMLIPDVVPINEVHVMQMRDVLEKLWRMMYGSGYEVSSPPVPSGAGGWLKILLTVSRYQRRDGGKPLPIPATLRHQSDELDWSREERLRAVESEIELSADEYEQRHRVAYKPEPAIMVSNALGRVGSQSGMGKSGEFARPLLRIFEHAFDDYLWSLSYSAEVDQIQSQLNLFLAQRILYEEYGNDGGLRPRPKTSTQWQLFDGRGDRTPLFHIMEALSVSCFRDGVHALQPEIMEMLWALTDYRDFRLSPADKDTLVTLLTALEKTRERLEQARLNFSRYFEAAMLAQYIVHGVARVDGRQEQEFSNFLRTRMIRDLNTRQRVFALLGSHLLNRQRLWDGATNFTIDLRATSPNEVIQRYLLNTEMHENVALLLLGWDSMQDEYQEMSRYHARVFQRDSLRTRIGDVRAARVEARLQRTARTTGKRFLTIASNRVPVIAPLLKTVLDDLESTEETDTITGTRTVGHNRPLPEQLPYFLRSTRATTETFVPPTVPASEGEANANAPKPELPPRSATVLQELVTVLEAINVEAKTAVDEDVALQRKRLQPEQGEWVRSGGFQTEYQAIQQKHFQVGRRITAVMQALESAFLEEQREVQKAFTGDAKDRPQINPAQAAADARATLAHHLIHMAPSAARCVVHLNEIVPLRGLQRQILIQIIREMLDQPEEFLDGWEGEATRFGSSVGTTSSRWRLNSKKSIFWGILIAGTVGGAMYLGWSYSADDPQTEVPTPAGVVEPADVEPSRPITPP